MIMNTCPALTGFVADLRGQSFGISSGQSTPAADGAALVMLGVVFFVAGMVVAFALTMRRRSRKPDPTLEFLARLHEEEKSHNPPPDPAPAMDAWERPADWWKEEGTRR